MPSVGYTDIVALAPYDISLIQLMGVMTVALFRSILVQIIYKFIYYLFIYKLTCFQTKPDFSFESAFC